MVRRASLVERDEDWEEEEEEEVLVLSNPYKESLNNFPILNTINSYTNSIKPRLKIK